MATDTDDTILKEIQFWSTVKIGIAKLDCFSDSEKQQAYLVIHQKLSEAFKNAYANEIRVPK